MVSEGNANDRYGRVLATCFVGGEHLNDRIVCEGWALDFRRYTSAYLKPRKKLSAGASGYGEGTSNRRGNGGRGAISRELRC